MGGERHGRERLRHEVEAVLLEVVVGAVELGRAAELLGAGEQIFDLMSGKKSSLLQHVS